MSRDAGIAARITGNTLEILYNGKPRLTGGHVVLQSSDARITGVSRSGDVFSFTTDTEPVDLSMEMSADAGIVSFSLSPNGNRSGSGRDFLGLFFDGIPEYTQGVTIWRYKPWNSWSKPIRIDAIGDMEDDDVQFFYWRYADGVYGAAIPLCGEGYRTTIGQEDGSFGAKSVSYYDGMDVEQIPQIAVGFGDDPYQLFSDLYEEGLTRMGLQENLAANKTFPPILDNIGWCTWNSSDLGRNLNEDFLLESAKSFADAGFPLKYIIVDDGWFDATNNQLNSFTPNRAKFPNGFAPVINRLKNEYGIADVGLWHAFNGYWQGINPDSPLGREFEADLFQWDNSTGPNQAASGRNIRWFISPYAASLGRFYDEFHTVIEQQGFSFLKVDNQLVTERMCVDNFPIWDGAVNYHRALYTSLAKHFDNTIINCMDMTPDAYFNFGSTAVARAVEDYFPYEEGETYDLQKGNAAAHVIQAVYNSLYFSQMVYPDFDMFESYNPNAVFHAIARAINSGPVYITDKPGLQDFDVLFPLVFGDGKLLRADAPLLPTEDCLFQVQDARPFKAYSRDGAAGLLGIWNCADADEVSGSFRPSDVHGIEGDRFAVYEYFSRELRLVGRDEPIPVTLSRMGYRLYYVIPLTESNAVIGLVNKYNAPKAVLKSDVSGNSIEATLYEGGLFAAVTDSRPAGVTVDGEAVEFQWDSGLLLVDIPGDGRNRDVVITL